MGPPASALVGNLVWLAAAILIKSGLVEANYADRVIGAQGEKSRCCQPEVSGKQKSRGGRRSWLAAGCLSEVGEASGVTCIRSA